MAKERLSKLQRWILAESYKLNVLHDGSVVGDKSSGFYKRRDSRASFDGDLAYNYFEVWIYENYYGFRNQYGDGFSQTPEYNGAHVTVSRSVRNLEEKGLIAVECWFNNRSWRITGKGIAALKKAMPDLFVDITQEDLNK